MLEDMAVILEAVAVIKVEAAVIKIPLAVKSMLEMFGRLYPFLTIAFVPDQLAGSERFLPRGR
jgi:hypothetical protein